MVTEIIKFVSCRGKYSEISFSVVCIKTKSTGAEIVLCQGHSSLGRLVGVLERTKKKLPTNTLFIGSYSWFALNFQGWA